MGNTILDDRTGAPSYTWLLCLTYVCFILNFTISSALNGGVPIQRATGSTTNDISPLLRFRFLEPAYYKLDDSTSPSESRENWDASLHCRECWPFHDVQDSQRRHQEDNLSLQRSLRS
jgi:hypothetical protein